MRPEKRRHARAPVLGVATCVWDSSCQATYLVTNVSAGGALLMGTRPIAVGVCVDVTLDLGRGRVFALRGTVARANVRADDDCDVAIAFARATAEVDHVVEAMAHSLRRRRIAEAPCALVIEGSDSARDALEADLRALGWRTLAYATPTAAVPYTSQPDARIDAAFVELAEECADGIDLLAMIGRVHPRARKIVLTAVEAAHAERVRTFVGDVALLRKPWSADELERALRGP